MNGIRVDQIPRQISLNRSLNNICGNVFFNTNTFMKNPLGLLDSLEKTYYKNYALPPAIKSKEPTVPLSPINGTYYISNGKSIIKWDKPIPSRDKDSAVYFVIYRFSGTDTVDISKPERIADIVYGTETNWMDTLNAEGNLLQVYPSRFKYVVTALDKFNNESNNHCLINSSAQPFIVFYNPDTLEIIRNNNIANIFVKIDRLTLVTLKIFDLSGNEINQLLHEYKEAGHYEINFDQKNIKSKGYIVQLKTKGYYSSKKVYFH